MSTTTDYKFDRSLIEVETSGAAIETIGGVAVIVLSIVGLAGFTPMFLAAIAGIVFGVSVFAQGTSVAAEFQSLFTRLANGALGAMELGAGMTVEIIIGLATVVLGVISLIGIVPEILLPALVIAGGATLVLSAGTVQRLNNLKMAAADTPALAQEVMHTATAGMAAGQLLAGVAASVLGIIALASPSTGTSGTWLTLTLVGLLVLGCSIMLSGGSLASRFVQMFGHEGRHS